MMASFSVIEVVPQDEVEQHEDREDRQGHDNVVEEHQDTIDPAADISGDQPDDDRDDP